MDLGDGDARRHTTVARPSDGASQGREGRARARPSRECVVVSDVALRCVNHRRPTRRNSQIRTELPVVPCRQGRL